MSFDPGLRPGDVIDNAKLVEIFKCSSQGGMRKSNTKNALVLVSNHTKSLYDDIWIDVTFHYTGMGTLGDQSLTFMQNKTLKESKTNGVEVFLFEVFTSKEYTFIGRVELAGEPYQTDQPDDRGQIRKVWMFPLKVVDATLNIPVDQTILEKEQARREKQAERLSDDELRKRAAAAKGKPGSRRTYSQTYTRNPDVAVWAKRRANGKCQLCDQPAPFEDRRGNPYLENHHLVWLSAGGEDTIENTVALCPNCHRKMHALNLKDDLRKLSVKAQGDPVKSHSNGTYF